MGEPKRLSEIIGPVVEELVRLNEIATEQLEKWKQLQERLRKDSELLDERCKELDDEISSNLRRIGRRDA